MYLITGASRGIGKSLALSLAKKHKVLITGRHEETLAQVARLSDQIDFLVSDSADEAQQSALVQNIQKKLSPNENLTGVIHNAGTIEPITPLKSLTAHAWRTVLETNLTAPFVLTQGLLPQLSKTSRVLHIGSGAAHFAVHGWGAYCVSKAGLSMLTKIWQLEHPQMPTACVMPGIIDTQMQHQIRHASEMQPDKLDFFAALKSQNQLISPETVAEFLTWLLCETSAEQFCSQEWDIYDTKHHHLWLKPPFEVPALP